MTSLLVLLSVAGLLALPMVLAKLHVALAPKELARVAFSTGIIGMTLFEAAAILCAVPIVTELLGGPMRSHFFPGGALAGWVSLGIAILIPGRILFVLKQIRRHRRTLQVESWFGSHVELQDLEMVIVPGERPIAFALPGRVPQVVLSEGALGQLGQKEVEAVLAHERAHLRNHHTFYLALAFILLPVAGLPLIGEGLRRLPIWLERWADDESASTLEQREAIRSSVIRLAATDYDPVAAR